MIFLDPGAKVWLPFSWERIIVQATVDECDDIYSKDNKNVWCHRYIDSSKDRVMMPTGKVDDKGWDIHESQPVSVIDGWERINQFVWVDEPVGHGIQPGEECFMSLEEARQSISVSSAKHLRRRLKSARGSVQRFIASTWASWGPHPGFKKLSDKRIYVRRS